MKATVRSRASDANSACGWSRLPSVRTGALIGSNNACRLAVLAVGLMLAFTAAAETMDDLYRAVADGNLTNVKRMLAEGTPAEPSGRSLRANNGVTPLMVAAHEGHDQIVRVLVEAGADPFALDDNNRSAAWYAAFKGRLSVFEFLMAREGARQLVDLREASLGQTMLHVAVSSDEPALTRALIGLGADRSIENLLGETPADICDVAVTRGCEGL